MNYPENREALKDSRKRTIQDLIDIQYESPIIHSVLALYQMNLVTLEEALILAIQGLHQSNKDLYRMCVDLSANNPPPPIVISKAQWEVLNKKDET
jgi:hypothetical protein